MNYQVEDAIERCKEQDAWPIKSEYRNGYYYLTANGNKRVLAAGAANTALANAEWPKSGRNAVLWVNAGKNHSNGGR